MGRKGRKGDSPETQTPAAARPRRARGEAWCRSASEVGGVLLGEVGPFFGQVVGGKDGRNRARGDAGAAVDALHRIDVELLGLSVVGFVLLGVDAIDRTCVYASRVLRADTRFCNDISHFLISPGDSAVPPI